jgi:undecaprenyl-diphosphatase
MPMWESIILAIIQAATEFLPISSSGHLAIFSNVFSKPDLFLFTILHFASLIAVIVFTRKEIFKLITFEKRYRKMWAYLIIATIPAAFFGFFLKNQIGKSFSSYLVLSLAFLFTSIILFSTKFQKEGKELNWKNSLGIGFFQILALLPGISRSGITISSARLFKVGKEEAVKFSFLLFIPLILGATILEIGNIYFSWTLVLAFFLCMALSLIFLNLLLRIVKANKFWIFGYYCLFVSFICGILYLIN